MYEVEPIIYRREQKGELDFIDTMDINYLSHQIYEASKECGVPKMSIGVLGFRNLEQTRRCVDSVLRYVGDIDYELILVDNGSDDGNQLYDYFQSVPTHRKKIIQVEEALGRTYGCIAGTQLMYQHATGDIFVFLGNDNIITENALQNMLRCLESSDDIGLVTPMSSNVYMLQNPGLQFETYEEMFEAAKAFNVYDPQKWQDRLLIATVATAIKREVLIKSGFYDFWSCETGMCLRIRQAGYRTILLGDTWVAHDHDYSTKQNSHRSADGDDMAKRILHVNDQQLNKILGGLTKFGDIMFFEHDLVNMLESRPQTEKIPRILAVEVRAGQGLLDLKNKLRTQGIFETTSVAFTTQAKYYSWLCTVADSVFCDRIEYMDEVLDGQKYDYILMGEAINLYPNPLRLLKKLMRMLEKNGQLLIKMRNTVDVFAFLKLLDPNKSIPADQPVHISLENVLQTLTDMGMKQIETKGSMWDVSKQASDTVVNLLNKTEMVTDDVMVRAQVVSQYYLICAQAPKQ